MSALPRESAAYRQAVREAPMLEADEEVRLIAAIRDRDDPAAKRRLIEAHLRLVIKTAARFKGYGVAMEDLVAEGNLGLMKALEGFDPERNLRFSTYALWWIKAAMFEHVLKFSTPVNFGLSAERKRLFFKLRGARDKVQGPEGGSLGIEGAATVGRDLGVSGARVLEMERLLLQTPRSLDAPVGEGGETFGALMADDRPDQEQVLGERQELMYRRELLKKAWDGLSAREQDIVSGRTLCDQPLRLEDLAQRYNISRERVRQIEGGALAKLKALVKTAMQAGGRTALQNG